MNTNELYIEYARVIEMCKGTELEDTPWMGVKREGACGFNSHPTFSEHSNYYEFAVGVLENKFVFVNDVIYYKCDGEKAVVEAFLKEDDTINIVNSKNEIWPVYVVDMNDDFTWTPPAIKRTFTLNWEELPCPVDESEAYGTGAIIPLFGETFYFKTVEDAGNVEKAIINLLTEARDK